MTKIDLSVANPDLDGGKGGGSRIGLEWVLEMWNCHSTEKRQVLWVGRVAVSSGQP